LEAYFLGKQRMATRVTDSLAEAVNLFQRAIELDPDFALAYVGLADTYSLQRVYAGFPQDEMNARSELAINKALELDNRLGEAYASLGLLNINIDNESAEAAFKRALELNPSYASAHQWYSGLLGNLGRLEEALAHIKIAVELDPLSAVINHNLAWSYIYLGRFDEAMAQFKSNIAIDPAFPGPYDGIGSLYRRVYGQLDKAVPWYEKVVAIDPGHSNGLAWLGLLVLDLGDDEQAEYWIDRSRDLAPDGFDANLAMHILHIYRGEDDQAADYAQKVLDAIPREWMGRVAAAYLSDRDLRSGRYVEARARYETAFPELLSGNDPAIDGTNYGAAINLALILSATGEMERANLLLDRSQSFIDTLQRLGYDGTWISDVQIYALQGQTAEALAALREAIDAGWRSLWWYYLEHDKNLDSIRDEPEFKAMVEEVRADIAAQLMRLREAKASGELAPIPKSLE
jgi:tetratricopeptide (TPR) repeat protein